MPEPQSVTVAGKIARLPLIQSIISVPESKTETLRWMVAIKGNVGLALLLVAVATLLIPGDSTGNIFYMMGICVAFLLANGIHSFILNRKPTERAMSILREAMIPVDVVLITIWVLC